MASVIGSALGMRSKINSFLKKHNAELATSIEICPLLECKMDGTKLVLVASQFLLEKPGHASVNLKRRQWFLDGVKLLKHIQKEFGGQMGRQTSKKEYRWYGNTPQGTVLYKELVIIAKPAKKKAASKVKK